MSTHINDFKNEVLIQSAGNTEVPAVLTTTLTGDALDFLRGDGNCFAIQSVGSVVGTEGTLTGKIQESTTTTSGDFTDVTGATFTAVTTSTNLQAINFQRTKRYLRYVGTVAGTVTSFAADAIIGQPLKVVPTG